MLFWLTLIGGALVPIVIGAIGTHLALATVPETRKKQLIWAVWILALIGCGAFGAGLWMTNKADAVRDSKDGDFKQGVLVRLGNIERDTDPVTKLAAAEKLKSELPALSSSNKPLPTSAVIAPQQKPADPLPSPESNENLLLWKRALKVNKDLASYMVQRRVGAAEVRKTYMFLHGNNGVDDWDKQPNDQRMRMQLEESNKRFNEYLQVYAPEVNELHRDLLAELPDYQTQGAVDYLNPTNGGGITGIEFDLVNLTCAYRRKLVNEGTLSHDTTNEVGEQRCS